MLIISTKQPVQVCQLFVPYPGGTINNCWRYKPDADECDECQYGHYLSGKICKGMSTQFVPHVEGTVENCLLYKRNANECLGCNFGHHLSEKTCASMDSILFPIEDRNE